MTAATLEGIPVEILEAVCEYLNPETLFLLSCTSWHCRTVANIKLFREIRLNEGERGYPWQDQIAWWTRVLEREKSFEQVRVLWFGQFGYKREFQLDGLLWQRGHRVMAGLTQLGSFRPRDTQQAGQNRVEAHREPPAEDDQKPDPWDALLAFVRRLTRLEHFYYACPKPPPELPARQNFFPDNLLMHLHEKVPNCRLHVSSVGISPFLDAKGALHYVPYASSPSLDSLEVRLFSLWGDEREGLEYYIKHIVQLAPSLKKVSYNCADSAVIESVREGINPNLVLDADSPLPKATRRAKITVLRLSYAPLMMSWRLHQWASFIDFSKIEELTLGEWIDGDSLDSVAEFFTFPSLSYLDIRVFARGSSEVLDVIARKLEVFLISLPPLKVLKVSGLIDSGVFRTILSHHGPTLVELALVPRPNLVQASFGSLEVRLICEHCPHLERLKLVVPRLALSAEENEIQKELGSFARLQHISLYLKVTIPKLSADDLALLSQSPDEDKVTDNVVDTKVHDRRAAVRGDLLGFLLNCAVSRQLAVFMFYQIAAKRKAFPLRSLELSTCFPGLVTDQFRDQHAALSPLPDFPFEKRALRSDDIFFHMRRDYLVYASNRDPDMFILQDAKYNIPDQDYVPAYPSTDLTPYLKTLIQNVWPDAGKNATVDGPGGIFDGWDPLPPDDVPTQGLV